MKHKCCDGHYLVTPHACNLPKLIFNYPSLHTEGVVGTVWQCCCGQQWEIVDNRFWNKWVKKDA